MLKIPITQERWNMAQIGEKKFHEVEPLNVSYEHYKNTFNKYFKYLEINKDLNNKSIIEIGPARFAGLLYCENYNTSYIVEPTTYDGVEKYYLDKNLKIINELYEDCNSPFVDEIWFLNLMQHVKDPDKLIEKAKKYSKIIRFFEPIDLGTDNEHPFSFSESDYRHYFGDAVKVYNSIGEENFHTAKCVYGIYKTDNYEKP